MDKGIFITGTGTDVGKTYASALFIKRLRRMGINAGYYKAALSGAVSIAESDAGYVNRVAGIGQAEAGLVSYVYKTAVSPHLAARIEGNPVCMERIRQDFSNVSKQYEYIVMEGSGGIVCPIRYDGAVRLFLEDIVKELALETLVVADAGLGAINAAVLTVEYLRQKGIPVLGILLNRYEGGMMQEDNRKMIEEMTGVPVAGLVRRGADSLEMDERTVRRIIGG